MARVTVVVNRVAGLQARAAEEFTQRAREATAGITVSRPGQHPVEADRMLLVISMEVEQGEEIVIEGDDAETVEALSAIAGRDDTDEPEPEPTRDFDDISADDPEGSR
ncbi:HPr family phosphocarrier protein [Stackebrandtia soli]|uniref:HPr family phosphocarrier protein n=1 Tax=Stackebrandtia soli TaxID=1892856 RepID=UPI0039E86CB4